MTHTRPSGTGWVTGQQGEPVTTIADPPGDGIGPDLTPPDRIESQDPAEYKRLVKDHKAAVKEINSNVLREPEPELNETAEVEPTPYQFDSGHPSSWEPADPTPELPDDPREQKPAAKDPREGGGKS